MLNITEYVIIHADQNSFESFDFTQYLNHGQRIISNNKQIIPTWWRLFSRKFPSLLRSDRPHFTVREMFRCRCRVIFCKRQMKTNSQRKKYHIHSYELLLYSRAPLSSSWIRCWKSNMSLGRLNERLVCLNSTTAKCFRWQMKENVTNYISFGMSRRCGW